MAFALIFSVGDDIFCYLFSGKIYNIPKSSGVAGNLTTLKKWGKRKVLGLIFFPVYSIFTYLRFNS